MKQKVYQLSLTTCAIDDVSIDLLLGVLSQCGFPIEEIVENRGRKQTSLSFYIDDVQNVVKLQKRLLQLHIKNVSIKLQTLLADTWINAWKDHFKPFQLTTGFDIVPVSYREEYKLKKNRVPIYIDTSLAFGTGMHETTQFVARFIENYRGRFETFIDIGTGTGILALMALNCGAQAVTAFDISRDAIEIANSNFKENGFTKVLASVADIYQYKVTQSYDFVAANLVTHDLLAVKDVLVALTAKGKYLALSGISCVNYQKVREGFKSLPLRCVKIERGHEWVALLFKKL